MKHFPVSLAIATNLALLGAVALVFGPLTAPDLFASALITALLGAVFRFMGEW